MAEELPFVTAIGAVVVAPDGRVLVVKRRLAPRAGAWTILGGKVEPGENVFDAAVRETREETGLAVRAVEELTILPIESEGHRYEVHEILCVVDGPLTEPRAADDADDARWVHTDDLFALGVDPLATSVLRDAVARAAARVGAMP